MMVCCVVHASTIKYMWMLSLGDKTVCACMCFHAFPWVIIPFMESTVLIMWWEHENEGPIIMMIKNMKLTSKDLWKFSRSHSICSTMKNRKVCDGGLLWRSLTYHILTHFLTSGHRQHDDYQDCIHGFCCHDIHSKCKWTITSLSVTNCQVSTSTRRLWHLLQSDIWRWYYLLTVSSMVQQLSWLHLLWDYLDLNCNQSTTTIYVIVSWQEPATHLGCQQAKLLANWFLGRKLH
jgi:hypothetical protein